MELFNWLRLFVCSSSSTTIAAVSNLLRFSFSVVAHASRGRSQVIVHRRDDDDDDVIEVTGNIKKKCYSFYAVIL